MRSTTAFPLRGGLTNACEPQDAAIQALARKLYAKSYRKLLAIAVLNSPSIDDAEECVQEAFLVFIERYEAGSDAPALAWLTLALKRMCWSRYRRAPRRPLSLECEGLRASDDFLALADKLVAPEDSPQERAERVEALTEARSRLSALKSDERHALTLLALGYTYNEIARTKGWTYTEVNRLMSEGRERLRELADGARV